MVVRWRLMPPMLGQEVEERAADSRMVGRGVTELFSEATKAKEFLSGPSALSADVPEDDCLCLVPVAGLVPAAWRAFLFEGFLVVRWWGSRRRQTGASLCYVSLSGASCSKFLPRLHSSRALRKSTISRFA